MRDEIARIIKLQSQFTSLNTPAMQERGLLVRSVLPQELREQFAAEFSWIEVEGRDGMGPKSRVPWVRMFDPERSPTARNGWYVVFLFHEDASGVTLSLNQAATEFSGDAFIPLPDETLARRVEWARGRLSLLPSAPQASTDISLGSGTLARAYERGHVIGYPYRGELPSEAQLVDNLSSLLRVLEGLYDLVAIAPPPGAPDPVIDGIRSEIELAAGKPARAGAPRRVSAAERAAIEMHAMFMAAEFLMASGWTLEDTHLKAPYDYVARRDGQMMFVEVKGTTGRGESVILTRNEVAHHSRSEGKSCLILVHDIILIPNEAEPTCTGGIREVWLPWTIVASALSPLAYEYHTPPRDIAAVQGDLTSQ